MASALIQNRKPEYNPAMNQSDAIKLLTFQIIHKYFPTSRYRLDPDALLMEKIITQYLHKEDQRHDAFPMKPSQAAGRVSEKKFFPNLPKPEDLVTKSRLIPAWRKARDQ